MIFHEVLEFTETHVDNMLKQISHKYVYKRLRVLNNEISEN